MANGTTQSSSSSQSSSRSSSQSSSSFSLPYPFQNTSSFFSLLFPQQQQQVCRLPPEMKPSKPSSSSSTSTTKTTGATSSTKPAAKTTGGVSGGISGGITTPSRPAGGGTTGGITTPSAPQLTQPQTTLQQQQKNVLPNLALPTIEELQQAQFRQDISRGLDQTISVSAPTMQAMDKSEAELNKVVESLHQMPVVGSLMKEVGLRFELSEMKEKLPKKHAEVEAEVVKLKKEKKSLEKEKSIVETAAINYETKAAIFRASAGAFSKEVEEYNKEVESKQKELEMEAEALKERYKYLGELRGSLSTEQDITLFNKMVEAYNLQAADFEKRAKEIESVFGEKYKTLEEKRLSLEKEKQKLEWEQIGVSGLVAQYNVRAEEFGEKTEKIKAKIEGLEKEQKKLESYVKPVLPSGEELYSGWAGLHKTSAEDVAASLGPVSEFGVGAAKGILGAPSGLEGMLRSAFFTPLAFPGEFVGGFIEGGKAVLTKPLSVESGEFIGGWVGVHYTFKGIGGAVKRGVGELRVLGTEAIPAEKLFDKTALEKVSKGESYFPVSSGPQEMLAKFEEGLKKFEETNKVQKAIATTDIEKVKGVGIHTTTAHLKKETTAGAGSSETPGLYVAPYGLGSPYFLRIADTGTRSLSFNPLDYFKQTFGSPEAVVVLSEEQVSRIPKQYRQNLVSAQRFFGKGKGGELEPIARKGQMYISAMAEFGKHETEAILTVGSKMVETGKRFQTRVKGQPVLVRFYKTELEGGKIVETEDVVKRAREMERIGKTEVVPVFSSTQFKKRGTSVMPSIKSQKDYMQQGESVRLSSQTSVERSIARIDYTEFFSPRKAQRIEYNFRQSSGEFVRGIEFAEELKIVEKPSSLRGVREVEKLPRIKYPGYELPPPPPPPPPIPSLKHNAKILEPFFRKKPMVGLKLSKRKKVKAGMVVKSSEFRKFFLGEKDVVAKTEKLARQYLRYFKRTGLAASFPTQEEFARFRLAKKGGTKKWRAKNTASGIILEKIF